MRVSLGPFDEDTNPIHERSAPVTHHILKAPPSSTTTLRVRISTYDFWETTNIWTMANPKNAYMCMCIYVYIHM